MQRIYYKCYIYVCILLIVRQYFHQNSANPLQNLILHLCFWRQYSNLFERLPLLGNFFKIKKKKEISLTVPSFFPERAVSSHKWLSPFIMCLWPTWKVPLLLLLLKNWVSPWLSIRCEKRKRSQGTKKWSSQNKTQTLLKEARGEGPITLLRIHKRNIFGCWRRRFGGCIKNQRNWLFCLNN